MVKDDEKSEEAHIYKFISQICGCNPIFMTQICGFNGLNQCKSFRANTEPWVEVEGIYSKCIRVGEGDH